MNKLKALVVVLMIFLPLSSCSSTVKTPPYLGVFLRDGSNFTPLDQFTGPPDGTPKASVDISNPTFTAWLEGFNAQNFLLVSYTSADRIKNKVSFDLRPLQEDNMYDVLVSELPVPDVYCFVLVDPLSVVYRMPHWCFDYGLLSFSSPTKTTKNSADILPTQTNMILPRTLKYTTQPGYSGIEGIAWSPDGEELGLAYNYYGSEVNQFGINTRKNSKITIFIVNAETGVEKSAIPKGNKDAIRDIAWNPDGTQLASLDEFGMVEIWDVLTKERVANFNNDRHLGFDIEWSPDGKYIVLAQGTYVRIHQANTGELIRSFSHNDARNVSFSPDSREIVVCERGKRVVVWDIQSQRMLAEIRGWFTDASWSPKGDKIAVGVDYNNWDLRVQIFDSNLSTVLMEISSTPDNEINWSPDGNFISIGVNNKNSGDAAIVKLETDTPRVNLAKYDLFTELIWDPNQKQLAGVGKNGISIFSVADLLQ